MSLTPINANYFFQSEKTCLTDHVRFRPRDFESILVNRLHISWRARGVQWASQQCLGSFHDFFGTELPKAFLCHTLFFFFWLLSLYSQLNLVLVDTVGCLDSLERPNFSAPISPLPASHFQKKTAWSEWTWRAFLHQKSWWTRNLFQKLQWDTGCVSGRKITEGLWLSAGNKYCWGSLVLLHHFCLNGAIHSCPKSSPFRRKLFSQAIFFLFVCAMLDLLCVGPFSYSYQKKSLTVSWSFNVNNEDKITF